MQVFSRSRVKGTSTHQPSGMSLSMTAMFSITSETTKSLTRSCMNMPLPARGGAKMENSTLPTGRREALVGEMKRAPRVCA
jgi:hypothetical protein